VAAADTRRPGFVSLADLLCSGGDAAPPLVEALPVSDAERAPALGAGESPPNARDGLPGAESVESAAAVRAARLFHAALGDAFDTLAAQLARDLACEVLMRELQLAPADVAALASRLLNERSAQEPLRLRVAPADAHIACDLPVVADPRLQAGDAVLECRSGEIDARLTVRLSAILAKVTP